MPHVTASTWEEIMVLRSRLAEQTSVRSCELEHSEWHVDSGVLRNKRSDFFQIVGFADDSGNEQLLIRQRETALVGLLVHGGPGNRSFLLNARCEPGLHGFCQLSTTIQSTPSNYERRHGGEPTPFIEWFTQEVAGTQVLHDSIEYDWGRYYDAKRKRFAIIEVPERVSVVSPLLWVGERELLRTLAHPFLMTTDLRVAIALMLAHDRDTEPGLPLGHDEPTAATASLREIPLEAMTNWRIEPRGIVEVAESRGIGVEYVTTTSASREVTQWSQPLVRIQRPDTVTLGVRGVAADREFAVERRTEIGLHGVALYFPAALADTVSSVVCRVRTSAEGGRFLHHEVVLQVADATGLSLTQAEHITWLGVRALSALLLVPEATSVELRTVATLALREVA